MLHIIITTIFLRKIRDNDVNRKRSINIERLLKINECSISVGFDRPGVIFDTETTIIVVTSGLRQPCFDD